MMSSRPGELARVLLGALEGTGMSSQPATEERNPPERVEARETACLKGLAIALAPARAVALTRRASFETRLDAEDAAERREEGELPRRIFLGGADIGEKGVSSCVVRWSSGPIYLFALYFGASASMMYARAVLEIPCPSENLTHLQSW